MWIEWQEGEGTPGATGFLEVQVVGGALLHSKKNGDGYVDSAQKMNKVHCFGDLNRKHKYYEHITTTKLAGFWQECFRQCAKLHFISTRIHIHFGVQFSLRMCFNIVRCLCMCVVADPRRACRCWRQVNVFSESTACNQQVYLRCRSWQVLKFCWFCTAISVFICLLTTLVMMLMWWQTTLAPVFSSHWDMPSTLAKENFDFLSLDDSEISGHGTV